MDAYAKIRFLLQPQILELLDRLATDGRDDLALSQIAELKRLPAAERAAVLEQRALRIKAGDKQSRAGRLVFTALGLMQMTSEPLARFKSRRLLSLGLTRIADLCCGLGGDSMHLSPALDVVGLDNDPAVLLAYRHNVSRFREAKVVRGNAVRPAVKADAFLIDPARRQNGGGRNWDGRDLTPSLDALEELVAREGHVGIKLGPGLDLPAAFADAEWEYLGLNDACLELMAWTGSLGKRGFITASELPSGAGISATREDVDQSFADLGEDSCSQPGAYLYEPVKCVVRAHLHAVLAQRLGLSLMDPKIAYLTGERRIDHPLVKRYAMVQELPNDLSAIRKVFRQENVGIVTVKKRGVPIIPEQVRAKIICQGGNRSATLVFTRLGKARRVFWVTPEEAFPGSSQDAETGLSDDECVPGG